MLIDAVIITCMIFTVVCHTPSLPFGIVGNYTRCFSEQMCTLMRWSIVALSIPEVVKPIILTFTSGKNKDSKWYDII